MLTTTIPTDREALPPQMIRLRTSLPKLSVPKGMSRAAYRQEGVEQVHLVGIVWSYVICQKGDSPKHSDDPKTHYSQPVASELLPGPAGPGFAAVSCWYCFCCL